MAFRNGFAVSDNDRRLIKDNALLIREALFSCMTETQVECAVGFARYLNRAGLNAENHWLFLRLLMTNNPWVIEELVHDRNPGLLFSTIRPEAGLIESAFQVLFSRHPDELCPMALEAVLGIVQAAYYDPDDGYRIRRLSIMDVNALGKFLRKDESQDQPLNRMILDILDKIAHIGGYYGEPDKNVLSKHAFNIRYAYFDRTRELLDAIPEPLLVRVTDREGVHPEEDFAELVVRRRQRKRDSAGRFVRENPDSGNGGAPAATLAQAAPEESGAPSPPAKSKSVRARQGAGGTSATTGKKKTGR
ncbi:MAG TPA: hypothetical protein VLH39_00665 [Magnetospirillaceae bacterium]|nr:hypothetical protein [Magnetospirillaceae bacterium]